MIKFVFSLIPLLLITNLFGANTETGIIPQPKSIKVLDDKVTFSLEKKIIINLVGTTEEETGFTAELIGNSLKDAAKTVAKVERTDHIAAGINLYMDKNFSLSAAADSEAYSLVVKKDNITITANSARGLFYGAMSLIQMIDNNKGKQLPCVEIADSPDMKVRGISDDISRGQVSTLDNFKKIIRHIARYKMNVYMPYLEDMVQLDAYPSIGKGRGALTKDEIKELVAYARKYYVDIIPIFQTLGHYENILSLPEFLKYAEFTGAASLCVSNDSTYVFLENMLREVFKLFPSAYFNMGADESYDVGLGKSKYLVEKTNMAEVHLQHYLKVYNICKKYNKKVLMYGDMLLSHPEVLEKLPKDITIVDWHYRADIDYPSTRSVNKAGFNYYVSPAAWNFLTTFPANLNAFPNIKYITKSGLENGSRGMINSNWGDYGAETFKELILFGYAWSAQCSWNLNGSDAGKFSSDYFTDFFGSNDPGIPAIYNELSNPFNFMMWNEVWRHPLLPAREIMFWEARMPYIGRINWIEYSTPTILKNIEAAEKIVTKNADHFELLKFMANLNLWFKSKLEAEILLQEQIKNPAAPKEELDKLLDKNINSLNKLKLEYKTLWLKYYKPDNLNMVEDKFDRLVQYFQEIKDQLGSGQVLTSPIITSKWIYCKPAGDTIATKTASFKKEIELSEKPSTALLQLLGDTHATLVINGQSVGEVYTRRTLSLWGEYKRFLFTDVAKYLKQGKNTIEVETENFNKTGIAGFNLTARINCGNKSLELISDESWQARANSASEWNTPFIKAYPYEVIAPNFKTGRTSWIER